MITPAEIAKNYLSIGEAKANLSSGKALVLGILAGLFIGLAGIASSVATAGGPTPGLGRLLGALIFPAALSMVVVTGCELFTGNCLMIIPALEGTITPLGMARNLAVVYLGNLLGGLIAAAAAVWAHLFDLFDGALGAYAITTAAAKCALPFGDAFLRGVFCNLLVCLALWMTFAAKEAPGKIATLFFPIVVFVLCGFEHSVANMYYIPAGLLALGEPSWAAGASGDLSALTWGAFLVRNLLPVTLGNMAGGMGLGAIYRWVYLKK